MTEFEAQQELSFIRRVMEDSRRRLVDDGMEYIVWGFLVVAGMLTTYAALELGGGKKIGWIWGICVGLGWLYSFVRGFRRYRQGRVKTLAGKIMTMIWLGSGITMTLLGFVGTATGFIKGFAVTPIISIVLGIPYLVSGIIIDSKLIRNLALGWWVGGIAMMIWPGRHMFVTFALMIIVFQIIPGMMLRKRWKQEYEG